MITEEIKIPTAGRPIEAFTMYRGSRPEKALLILPGKGYTINHFLLDFIWRMAAELGFFSVKAEYRGFTYRHLNEPYELEDAVEDVTTLFRFFEEKGYNSTELTVCAKSLGTLALASTLINKKLYVNKAVLLTPVLYFNNPADPLTLWDEYAQYAGQSYVLFGGNDPFCDLESARNKFPESPIELYPGADHGLHLESDYKGTIDIQCEIINKIKAFIS